MNANAGNIVLGPGNGVLKGLGAGSNGGAAAPAPPAPKKSYPFHPPAPSTGVGRSNRSVSFSPAPAPAQAWPVLNSSTLGTFQQPPPPTSVAPATATPMVRSPSHEIPPAVNAPQSAVEPRGFEDNFPVLAGPKSAGPLSPSIDRPTSVVWGKPDMVSKVAAPPAKPKDVGPELDMQDLYIDPAEAAEMARLRALVPKLNAPKPGKPGPRERSKTLPSGKNPVAAPPKPAPPKPVPAVRPVTAKPATVAPVFIANRPKLRSTMKASPQNKHAFPPKQAESTTTPPEPMKKSDSGIGGWPQRETSMESSQRTGRSPSVSSGAGSDHHVRATSSSASPSAQEGQTNGVFEDGEGMFDASFEHGSYADVEDEDHHDNVDAADEIRSQASSTEPDWSHTATPHPRRASALSPLLSEPSSRSTSPVAAPSTPAIDAHHHHHPAEHDEDGLKNDLGRCDPYAMTFQYSASLEKEEQFLRSLGWDKSAYYDSDVDESEFVITDEEKREFW
ncbi:hypothetical protein HK097_002863, partial [Rhizophlyctis rosea]